MRWQSHVPKSQIALNTHSLTHSRHLRSVLSTQPQWPQERQGTHAVGAHEREHIPRLLTDHTDQSSAAILGELQPAASKMTTDSVARLWPQWHTSDGPVLFLCAVRIESGLSASAASARLAWHDCCLCCVHLVLFGNYVRKHEFVEARRVDRPCKPSLTVARE